MSRVFKKRQLCVTLGCSHPSVACAPLRPRAKLVRQKRRAGRRRRPATFFEDSIEGLEKKGVCVFLKTGIRGKDTSRMTFRTPASRKSLITRSAFFSPRLCGTFLQSVLYLAWANIFFTAVSMCSCAPIVAPACCVGNNCGGGRRKRQ